MLHSLQVKEPLAATQPMPMELPFRVSGLRFRVVLRAVYSFRLLCNPVDGFRSCLLVVQNFCSGVIGLDLVIPGLCKVYHMVLSIVRHRILGYPKGTHISIQGL